jgi:hypothetical protein
VDTSEIPHTDLHFQSEIKAYTIIMSSLYKEDTSRQADTYIQKQDKLTLFKLFIKSLGSPSNSSSEKYKTLFSSPRFFVNVIDRSLILFFISLISICFSADKCNPVKSKPQWIHSQHHHQKIHLKLIVFSL